jgi:hypothetical protein
MKPSHISRWAMFISISEIVVALILIVREVYQLITLRSIYATDNGLIEFEKYKENTYAPLFMWYILLLIGMFSIRKDKYSWIFHQAFIVLVFLTKFSPLFITLSFDLVFFLIFIAITFSIFTFIEIILFKSSVTDFFEIKKKHLIHALIFGVLCSIIYWYIEIWSINETRLF